MSKIPKIWQLRSIQCTTDAFGINHQVIGSKMHKVDGISGDQVIFIYNDPHPYFSTQALVFENSSETIKFARWAAQHIETRCKKND
jgi:hypothetical protein